MGGALSVMSQSSKGFQFQFQLFNFQLSIFNFYGDFLQCFGKELPELRH